MNASLGTTDTLQGSTEPVEHIEYQGKFCLEGSMASKTAIVQTLSGFGKNYGRQKLGTSLADACRQRHPDIDRQQRTDGVLHRW